MYQAWIEAMQNGIGAAFQRAMSAGDVGIRVPSVSPSSLSVKQTENNSALKPASGTSHMPLVPSHVPPKPKRTRYICKVVLFPIFF